MRATQDHIGRIIARDAPPKQGEIRVGILGVLPLLLQLKRSRPPNGGVPQRLRSANRSDVALCQSDLLVVAAAHKHKRGEACEVHVGGGVPGDRHPLPGSGPARGLPQRYPDETVRSHALPTQKYGTNIVSQAVPEPTPQEYILRVLIR
jgi:hypothetical protein